MVEYGLDEFMRELDLAVGDFFEPRDVNGHKDLPGYDPRMGPRYGIPGHDVPLSVFRGEGMALFLVARAIKPEVIMECYTGTGYAACCLAAGWWPEAQVISTDNYTEGGLGEAGWARAQGLRDKLGLDNLALHYGTIESLRQANLLADLYFSDGPYDDGASLLAEGAIRIRHDDGVGQVDGRRFVVPGGSNLSVTCPTIEMRDWLMAEIGKTIPVNAA